MGFHDLVWEETHSPVNDAVIQNIENQLGVKFPEDFVNYAQICHGGYPCKRVFDFWYNDNIGLSTSGFNLFYSFDTNEEINILQENLVLPEGTPDGLILFGEDGGGGYICFDYRTTPERPGVVFWISDAAEDRVHFLAPSFTDFLASLREPEELPEEE